MNNAGVSGSGEQDLFSTQAWNRIMEINATGVFLGMKHALPAMIAAGGGSIVNMSSVAGIAGSDGIVPYTCAEQFVVLGAALGGVAQRGGAL